MLRSLLTRYQAEGERMLENTDVFVCSVCGFVYVGDVPPEICPVCKVPSWKFDRVERRACDGGKICSEKSPVCTKD